MSNLKPLKIDIVSDVVCPWCYIGKHRIESALAMVPDVPVEVNWRPFFLNSWVPREGISRDEYLTAKFGSPEAYKGISGVPTYVFAQKYAVSGAQPAEQLARAIRQVSAEMNAQAAE